MIFALLGLASDSDVAENPPDYALSIENVGRRFVRSYILRYRNLLILNCVNRLSTNSNHPPWLFHHDKFNLSSVWEELYAMPLVPFRSSERSRFRQFKATKDSDPILTEFGDLKYNLIILRGFLAGAIDYLGMGSYYNLLKKDIWTIEPRDDLAAEQMRIVYTGFASITVLNGDLFYQQYTQRQALQKCLKEWEHQAMARSEVKPLSPYVSPGESNEQIQEAFWRTMMADSTLLEDDIGSKAANQPQHGLRGSKPSGNGQFGSEMKSLTSGPPITVLNLFKFENLFQACQAAVGPRQFFLSESGWMGLAPTAAIKGDIICLFLGGATPFIIRPAVNGQYQFIGECYVHGMMDGEAIDDLENGKYKLQDIALLELLHTLSRL